MQLASKSETAERPNGLAGLRLVKADNPYLALGLAVNHLMVIPAFAKLRFGDWSRILVGQVNRGHYAFVIEEKNEIQGFLGWAFATREKAEAWVMGRAGLSYEDSQDGDCLLINAWTARSPAAGRLLRDAARRIGQGKQAVYFKRHYPDGTTRPMRLRANAFVERHLQKAGGAG